MAISWESVSRRVFFQGGYPLAQEVEFPDQAVLGLVIVTHSFAPPWLAKPSGVYELHREWATRVGSQHVDWKHLA